MNCHLHGASECTCPACLIAMGQNDSVVEADLAREELSSKPYYEHAGIAIYHGDALSILRKLPDESVNCCITSPPYWGLRDYGVSVQIGLEATPQEFVEKMVAVFEEVRRVLKPDGTLWLNLGDSYCGGGRARGKDRDGLYGKSKQGTSKGTNFLEASPVPEGLKPKDLAGIPWRVAFALQDAGWWLRSDIIWAKPAPMPESVKDRPTRSHEYLFLLAKSERYYYDADAIKEPVSGTSHARGNGVNPKSMKVPSGWDTRSGSHTKLDGRYRPKQNESFSGSVKNLVDFRNKRDVWTVNSDPFPEAHFATFPPALILPCVLAGCPAGGTILDPFMGAGTTALVARENGRLAIGIELSAEYCDIAAKRLGQEVLQFA